LKTEDVQRCLRRLIDSGALLDAGRSEGARAVLASVRIELDAVEELTAPVSLALMMLEHLESRIG
jgi:hypothetical protein